nr:unnamed protein product [Digitaria exilis]
MSCGRHHWNGTATRDALALNLVAWLSRRPEWRAMGGRNHSLPAGRPAEAPSRRRRAARSPNSAGVALMQDVLLRVVARSTEAALQRTELLTGAQEKGCWVGRGGGGGGACRGEEDDGRGHGEEG